MRFHTARNGRSALLANSLLAIFFLLLPFPAVVYGVETISALLAQAQRLIALNRTPEALKLLTRAAQLAMAETRSPQLGEEALWQNAMEHLNFADTLENKASRKRVAALSHEAWSNYIEWYSKLSKTDIGRLPRPNQRINSATAHLGNAAFMMGAPSKLLDDYPQYANNLGPDAINLWKSALYACPNWKIGEDRSAATRAKKICDDSCNNYWITYADSLKDWLTTFNLKKAVRDSYSREADQILAAAGQCG